MTRDELLTATEDELCQYLSLVLDGDDLTANTGERQTLAVRSWLESTGEWGLLTIYTGDVFMRKLSRGIELARWYLRRVEHGRGLTWLIDDSGGKPWQSALETHVANYRAESPYKSKHFMDVVEACRKRGVFVILEPYPEQWLLFDGKHKLIDACNFTELRVTVLRACCLGLWEVHNQ